MNTVDLGQYRSPGSIILSGFDRGNAVRREAGLDAFDIVGEPTQRVLISAPSDVEIITASFVQGLFAKSLTTLGSKEAFFRRYEFSGPEELKRDLERGLEFAARRGLPF